MSASHSLDAVLAKQKSLMAQLEYSRAQNETARRFASESMRQQPRGIPRWDGAAAASSQAAALQQRAAAVRADAAQYKGYAQTMLAEAHASARESASVADLHRLSTSLATLEARRAARVQEQVDAGRQHARAEHASNVLEQHRAAWEAAEADRAMHIRQVQEEAQMLRATLEHERAHWAQVQHVSNANEASLQQAVREARDAQHDAEARARAAALRLNDTELELERVRATALSVEARTRASMQAEIDAAARAANDALEEAERRLADASSGAARKESERWEAVLARQREHWQSVLAEKEALIKTMQQERSSDSRAAGEARAAAQSHHEQLQRVQAGHASELAALRAEMAQERGKLHAERSGAVEALRDAEQEHAQQIAELTRELDEARAHVARLRREHDQVQDAEDQRVQMELRNAASTRQHLQEQVTELAAQREKAAAAAQAEASAAHTLRLQVADLSAQVEELQRGRARDAAQAREAAAMAAAEAKRRETELERQRDDAAAAAHEASRVLDQSTSHAAQELDRERSADLQERERARLRHAAELDDLRKQAQEELAALEASKAREAAAALRDQARGYEQRLAEKDVSLARSRSEANREVSEQYQQQISGLQTELHQLRMALQAEKDDRRLQLERLLRDHTRKHDETHAALLQVQAERTALRHHAAAALAASEQHAEALRDTRRRLAIAERANELMQAAVRQSQEQHTRRLHQLQAEWEAYELETNRFTHMVEHEVSKLHAQLDDSALSPRTHAVAVAAGVVAETGVAASQIDELAAGVAKRPALDVSPLPSPSLLLRRAIAESQQESAGCDDALNASRTVVAVDLPTSVPDHVPSPIDAAAYAVPRSPRALQLEAGSAASSARDHPDSADAAAAADGASNDDPTGQAAVASADRERASAVVPSSPLPSAPPPSSSSSSHQHPCVAQPPRAKQRAPPPPRSAARERVDEHAGGRQAGPVTRTLALGSAMRRPHRDTRSAGARGKLLRSGSSGAWK